MNKIQETCKSQQENEKFHELNEFLESSRNISNISKYLKI